MTVVYDLGIHIQLSFPLINFDLLKVSKFHFSACWDNYRAEYSVLSGVHTYSRIFSIPSRLYLDMFALSLTALANHKSGYLQWMIGNNATRTWSRFFPFIIII